jgi:CDP-6-deoxy-D-xylo-4-hexulose-3-dehydrase
MDQIKYMNKIIGKREKNYKQLSKIYNNQDFIEMDVSKLTKISNFAFPIICKTKALRDKYLAIAKKVDIEVRPIVAGNISNQIFFKKYVKEKYLLLNTENIHNNGFYFGNNPDLTKKEIDFLVKTFK